MFWLDGRDVHPSVALINNHTVVLEHPEPEMHWQPAHEHQFFNLTNVTNCINGTIDGIINGTFCINCINGTVDGVINGTNCSHSYAVSPTHQNGTTTNMTNATASGGIQAAGLGVQTASHYSGDGKEGWPHWWLGGPNNTHNCSNSTMNVTNATDNSYHLKEVENCVPIHPPPGPPPPPSAYELCDKDPLCLDECGYEWIRHGVDNKIDKNHKCAELWGVKDLKEDYLTPVMKQWDITWTMFTDQYRKRYGNVEFNFYELLPRNHDKCLEHFHDVKKLKSDNGKSLPLYCLYSLDIDMLYSLHLSRYNFKTKKQGSSDAYDQDHYYHDGNCISPFSVFVDKGKLFVRNFFGVANWHDTHRNPNGFANDVLYKHENFTHIVDIKNRLARRNVLDNKREKLWTVLFDTAFEQELESYVLADEVRRPFNKLGDDFANITSALDVMRNLSDIYKLERGPNYQTDKLKYTKPITEFAEQAISKTLHMDVNMGKFTYAESPYGYAKRF